MRPGIDTDDLAKLIREDFDNDSQDKRKSKKEGEDIDGDVDDD